MAVEAGALATELARSAASVQALAYYRIPLFLLPMYRAAAAQYGVPWQILAAINEIETDYGNDLSVSTAGAVGWMQFMPATWIEYGVDALNAGYADPYNPVDAIFAAARYLRAAGAQSNLRAAILAYNHSAAYVDSVLLRARLISSYPKLVIGTLTGLIDARPPVSGKQLKWGASSSSSASAHAQVPSHKTASSRAQQAPQLIGLMSTPNAAVVAVQAGRIMQLGRSRKLGKYIVLRDIYGDVFTYAALGSVARTYRLAKAPRTPLRAPVAASENTREGSPDRAANAAVKLPLTLLVKAPKRTKNGAGASGAAVSVPPWSGASTPAGLGKFRLFAHPGNADELTAEAPTTVGAEPRGGLVDRVRRLRVGSLVAKGTMLGRVAVPPGAKDGHLRFAIRPAGDPNTIDPAPVLANWTLLDTAVHPQGVKGEANLLGATASDVWLLSKSQLQLDVLSDPGIAMHPCFRAAVASSAIDKRVLALLAFLSRSGLQPTVGGQSCGGSAYRVSGYEAGHIDEGVAISQINGVPIAGHQGARSITDTAIRMLLTLRGEFLTRRIVSLMHYPGVSRTLARADHADYLEVDFSATPKYGLALLKSSAANGAHSAAVRYAAAPPLQGSGEVTAAQWDQVIARIRALPAPTIPAKPSSAAIYATNPPVARRRVALP